MQLQIKGGCHMDGVYTLRALLVTQINVFPIRAANWGFGPSEAAEVSICTSQSAALGRPLKTKVLCYAAGVLNGEARGEMVFRIAQDLVAISTSSFTRCLTSYDLTSLGVVHRLRV